MIILCKSHFVPIVRLVVALVAWHTIDDIYTLCVEFNIVFLLFFFQRNVITIN